jgi:hypothetical protein
MRYSGRTLELGNYDDGCNNTVTARIRDQKTAIANQQLREHNNIKTNAKQRGYITMEELMEAVFSMRSMGRP